MDIARLLTPNDSDFSDDHGPVVDAVASPPNRPTRSRRGRRRKVELVSYSPNIIPHSQTRFILPQPSITSMRAQVEAYEYVVANLPAVLKSLHREDTTENSRDLGLTGNHDSATTLIRTFLRRTLLLAQEEHNARAQHTEYLRLLKQHVESTANLRKLMRGLALDDWYWQCERWRTLTNDYYKPIRSSECFRLMREALDDIKAFKYPRPIRQARPNNFFGWRDTVTRIENDGYVHFMTRKTHRDVDLHALVDHTWSIYQDGNRYKQYMLGQHCQLWHQVLQRVTPDIIIMQTIEQYRGMTKSIHSVSIVFRVATETGFLIAIRCIHAPELASVMASEGLARGDNFFWCAWDVTKRDNATRSCLEFESTLGGHIGSDYDAYARWWVTEFVLSLVRAETNMGMLVALEPDDSDA